MDLAHLQLASGIVVPPRCAIQMRIGSNQCAGFLKDRGFEAVAMLRHCLFVFFFLVERIITNRLSVANVEAEWFSGKT